MALGREELREHALEASRGCTSFSLSRPQHSQTLLAVAVGRKVLIYRWLHQEDWLSFTQDTVAGWELQRELYLAEPALLVSLVEREAGEQLPLTATRRGWELAGEGGQEPVLQLQQGDTPSGAQEVEAAIQ